jgi:beta-glucosidase
VRNGRITGFTKASTFWSPNINIFRDPRWGRGQETYGEDPFLTGRMGVAFVTGMQGDDPQILRTIATPKHYAVHSGPEPTRHGVDVVRLQARHGRHLSAAVPRRGGGGQGRSVMCAYNSINGQPACASTFLLKDTLRGVGLPGLRGVGLRRHRATSPFARPPFHQDASRGGGHQPEAGHGQRIDGIRKEFADAKVVFAPGTKFLRDPVAVPSSALTTADGQLGLTGEYFNSVDLSGSPIVTRIDPQINFRFITYTVPGLDPRGFSVRWSGNLLAADTGTYTLSVTGGDTYRFSMDGKVVIDNPDRHGAATKTADVKLERGHKYAIQLEYFHPNGTEVARLSWLRTDGQTREDAVKAAQAADVAIAVVGITADLEGEEMKVDVPGFLGGDRVRIDLPKDEQDLLEAVKATGKPLIVVLMSGSALAVNWASRNANAILEAWYPGEEGGTAIAETLSGANNPAGRLPVTFYKGVEELPPFVDYSMKNRTYRYFTGRPLYPFGYGLSYSKFVFSNLKLSAATVRAGDSLDVDADVRNSSARSGDAVAELYLSFPQAPGVPIRALRGFSRVPVAAGKTQHVHFKLDPRALSSVTESGDRVVAAGAYKISVGGGQPGMGASTAEAQFTVEGAQKLPE